MSTLYTLFQKNRKRNTPTLFHKANITVSLVTDFTFLGSKITVDSDCNHRTETCLLHGRKSMTSLDSILKSKDITLSTKIHIVKAVVFPVVMCGCKSWTIKKAECQTNWCFWTVVLEKTLEGKFGLQGDQSSQSKRKSTLNIHWKDWCWSWSFNSLATWCEELTHWRKPWCWERLRARGEGATEDRRLDGITDSVDMNLSKLWEMVKDREAWHATDYGVAQSWTWPSAWTITRRTA